MVIIKQNKLGFTIFLIETTTVCSNFVLYLHLLFKQYKSQTHKSHETPRNIQERMHKFVPLGSISKVQI